MIRGCRVIRLGNDIEGEAREVARAHAALALQEQARLRHGDAPVIILSGGELTVTRRGEGVGGPNAEYALALMLALDGAAGVWGLACDTDGVDGAAEVAGAIIGPDSLDRAHAANDAHGFFDCIGGQVITGPTLTNVNDFRALVVFPG